MDSENEIIIDGVKYVAVKEEDGCYGCVFYDDRHLCAKFKSLHCTKEYRKDKRNVIFKRKDMGETKEIKINVPDGYEIDKEKSSFEHIVFKKKENKLPETWEEFCENNKYVENEHFINGNSEILKRELCNYDYRNPNTDKNLLPSKELAEAMLALCQLLQLRDCYNQGWKPDWTTNDFKYCIAICGNQVFKDSFWNAYKVLSFKTKEICDEFYNNFKELIEIAKPLL